MKRTFYLVTMVLFKMQGLTPLRIIELIFPESDVQTHLLGKLQERWTQYLDYSKMIESFYISLDGPHQLMFDTWFNRQIKDINSTTVQHCPK